MKWAGTESVAVSQIVLTDDIRERTKAAHVAELAESMRDVTGNEPGNALWVRQVGSYDNGAGKYEVVAGRDRMAAVLMLKVPRVPVRIIAEHTPVELIKAEAHENLRRRHDDPVAIVAEMTRALEAEASRDTGTVSRKPGRPETAKGEARREVAKAAGVKVETLRKAEQRQKAREEGERRHAAQGDPVSGSSMSPSETPPLSPPIETWGMPFGESHRELVQPVLDALAAADRHMRAAQAALSGCGVMDGAVASRLREDAHRLAANIRAAMPAALCPWCKWAVEVGGGYVTSCHGCRSFGWVTAEVLEAAPPELRAPDVYAVAGVFYCLAAAKEVWAKVSRLGKAVLDRGASPAISAQPRAESARVGPPSPRGTKAENPDPGVTARGGGGSSAAAHARGGEAPEERRSAGVLDPAQQVTRGLSTGTPARPAGRSGTTTKKPPRNTIVMPGGETFDPYAQEAPPASDADLPEPPDDDVPPMDDDEGLAF